MAFVRGLIAAVSSIWMGVGFGLAALGRTRRGAAWLALLLIVLALASQSIWFLVVAAVVYVASLADTFACGYRSTQEPPFRWFRVSTIGMVVVFIGSAVVLRVFLVESFKIPASSMYPTLEIGDHLMISKAASFEPGDVVVFRYPCDPDRDYIKRVIARGGDTVEVRCNVVYVNGKVLQSQLVESGETCKYTDYDELDNKWFRRTCSRYRETLGDHTYEVFHDDERPARDASPTNPGDARDFPSRSLALPPSCTQSETASSHGQIAGTIVETKHEYAVAACEPQLHYVVPADHVFVLGDNRNNSNDSRIWGGVPTSAIKGPVVGIWGSKQSDGWTLRRFGPID